MANKAHLRILRTGRDAWNAWRKKHPAITPNLANSDISGMDLKFVNFRGVNLSGANLSSIYATHGQFHNANLRGADLKDGNFSEASFFEADLSEANGFAGDFSDCDFQGAKLNSAQFEDAHFARASFADASMRYANFTEADFSFATLQRAILHSAILVGTNLNGSDLDGADLTAAQFGNTLLANTTFKSTLGLDSINHIRRSSIDVDTLVASGELPSRFLQGLGLSDNIIDYLPSLLNRPIQFYSCFISYASKDEAFARRLHSDLQANGVRCWFAPKDMKIGERIRDSIDTSIRLHDRLLLVLSRSSIASAWVEKEVETAFEQETKRKAVVLFPIRLDDSVLATEKAWAADIKRMRHIGDFRKWKEHDAYSTAFARLLNDLQAAGINTGGNQSGVQSDV